MSKDFFGKINIQNAPRAPLQLWYIRKRTLNSNPEFSVLDWEFTLDLKEDSFGTIEGTSPYLNFRKAFLPEDGHYWVSRDFSGQELRIMSNLANEKKWIDAFLHDRDIHQATAEAIWGKENFNSSRRNAAKTLNFGLLYGMSSITLADRLKVSKDEAEATIEGFFKGLPNIKKALNHWVALAERNQEITNLYGRKRRMKQYIRQNGKISTHGKNAAYNFPVQSLGAEIIKLAIIRVYNDILINEKYKDKVIFMNTIHDEINFSIDKDILKEAIYDIGIAMEHTIPGRPVPIIAGLEIGTSMGITWPFIQDLATKELIPEYKKL